MKIRVLSDLHVEFESLEIDFSDCIHFRAHSLLSSYFKLCVWFCIATNQYREFLNLSLGVYMKKLSSIMGFFFIIVLSGCVSMSDVNNAFRDVDTAWEKENKKQIERLHREVESNYKSTFDALETTFNNLNMPIIKSSIDKGYIMSRTDAPKPLSVLQWAEVRKIENPKLKNISWMMTLEENPSGYIITIKAQIFKLENRMNVTLEYYLEMPKYEDMGYIPSNQVPPHSLILMTEMFWDEFDKNLRL